MGQCDPRHFFLAFEQADEDPFGVARDHGDVGPAVLEREPQRRRAASRPSQGETQVITEGSLRRCAARSRDVARQGDQIGKRRLRLDVVPAGIGLVAFDIDAQRGARRAGAGEAVDDARAVLEQQADSLARGARAVDRIVIGEIIGLVDAVLADECGKLLAQRFHQAVGRLGIDLLIVVA